MAHLYTEETPAEIKNAKGLHLITQNTPNGQAVQILLEELKDVYGTEWTTSVIDISTNVQKSDWYLRLNPNGRETRWTSCDEADRHTDPSRPHSGLG